MPKFRKRPVVIEAERFDGSAACAEYLLRHFGGNVRPEFGHTAATHDQVTGRMAIDTPTGTVYATAGDWILRGVKGEVYPCKDDVFRATYVRVAESEED